MRDIIVLFDGQPLVIIKDCPPYALLVDIRKAYAKVYGFDATRLTVRSSETVSFKSLGIQ